MSIEIVHFTRGVASAANDRVEALASDIVDRRQDESATDARGNKLVLFKRNELPTGASHTRLNQYYHDVPVEGYQVISHTTPAGERSLTGAFVDGLDAAIGAVDPAALDLAAVLQRVEQEFADGHSVHFSQESSKLVIFVDEKALKARLAVKVEFFAEAAGNPSKPITFVDASTGETLKSYNNLQTGPGFAGPVDANLKHNAL